LSSSFIFITLIKTVFVFQLTLMLASVCIWIERKASALIQNRVGANRAGTFFKTDYWLLKPIFFVIRVLGKLGFINTLVCDALKALFKEDFIPAGSSKFLHAIAPMIAVVPVFLSFAVLPMYPEFEIFGYTISSELASLNYGVLFVFAMGSISVYGVAIAGWCSNNKFSLLGALRAVAQMISYELALGLCLVTLVLSYQTFDLTQIVNIQSDFSAWGIFSQPITFIVFLIAGMAETKRGPFDLPEAESELAAGYFTEYSGMKFLLFWLGEFAEIALFAFLITVLFFGGWNLPFLDFSNAGIGMAILGHIILISKVVFFMTLQVVIRWTVPRFRFDQLMNLGWKMLLPISIINLIFTAFFKLLGAS